MINSEVAARPYPLAHAAALLNNSAATHHGKAKPTRRHGQNPVLRPSGSDPRSHAPAPTTMIMIAPPTRRTTRTGGAPVPAAPVSVTGAPKNCGPTRHARPTRTLSHWTLGRLTRRCGQRACNQGNIGRSAEHRNKATTHCHDIGRPRDAPPCSPPAITPNSPHSFWSRWESLLRSCGR